MTPIKGFYVKNKVTGEVKYAVYAANRLGNLRMAIDGKFYTDKEFEKLFKKINNESFNR